VATWVALLSGEHPTLPAAELRALLDVHEPEATLAVEGLVARIGTRRPEAVRAALARAALVHEAGPLWGEGPDTPEGLEALARQVRAAATGAGSAAVASERRGLHKSGRSLEVERRLGGALRDAGHPIDLEAPVLGLFAWLLDGRIVAGERAVRPGRAAYAERVADKRAHFSPVSLHPRRAASLLHLARVPPGGRVYDPFCGTGAFVLEAALEGHDAWGSDLDPWMVQGTWQTLTDAGPEPLDATVFEADVGDAPRWVGQVEGIVTDLPYGRASSSGREGLAALYRRAFEAFARLLPPGRLAVVGHPDPALLEPVAGFGFEVVERHEERAHRSLVRHFAVVKRLEGVEGGG
jgi:tRNA (guanine10-N2)-dimethyltransferase